MISLIHHTFGPHVTASFALRSLMILLQPWKWKSGRAGAALAVAITERFNAPTYLFSSGREALLAALKSLNLKAGEEVIIQGYTCIVVPNAVHSAGGTPVYADIDPDSLNLNTETVREKLSDRTRAVICQHTFGIPADTEGLRTLCDERNILLIEDCAHIMPDELGPHSIAQKGDFVFFSFGRDKAISGIAGGALLTRNRDYEERIEEIIESSTPLTTKHIFTLLCYSLLYIVARPFMGIGIGKALLLLAKKMGLLVQMYAPGERQGIMNPEIHTLPNACAILALSELRRLEDINNARRNNVSSFLSKLQETDWVYPSTISASLPLQKLPLLSSEADSIRSTLKKKNIHLDDGWTSCAICPKTCDPQKANYHPGDAPQADLLSQKIISLPTHPTTTERQIDRLVKNLT